MATFEELMAKSRELNAAGDVAGARRVAEIAMKQKRAIVNRKGLTGVMGGVEQFGAGLNEGIASFAGAPVDLMTGALNFGSAGLNAATGMNIPRIENPAGGSGTMLNVMDPVISDRPPATMAERYARRGGQEVGFGVPAALTGASFAKFGAPARASAPLTGNLGKDALRFAASPYMATSLAGDVGAAIGGQTAQEIAPGNTTADFFASMIGGTGGSLAASNMTPSTAPVMTLDELKSRAKKGWDTVAAAPETLTDSATSGLDAAVRQSLPTSQLAPNSYPKAFGVADDVSTLNNPRIYDVEEARRIVGDRVASDPSEARVGVQIKQAISDYLNGLKPTDLQGGAIGPRLPGAMDPDDVIDALARARRDTHQVKKAEAILNKEMRGETRAATSGSGGNEVNATRQNIRTLFDKERDVTLSGKRAGYTPDEMAAMENVVIGTRGSNTARNLGKLAPTSGALPMMATGWGGAGGLGLGLATGNPMLAIPAAAGGVGFAAKAIAESMTKKQIEELLKTVLNGGKAPGVSAGRAASQRAVIEQLLSGAASGQPQ